MENSVTIVAENKDNESKVTTESAPGRKNPKEEKARKKDDRNVEQVLKALNSLDTTEEKLAAMCKKYADTVDENRKLQLSLKQTDKRLAILQREKEQLQTEHSKAVLTRSRLESLCRELQRQNKAVKDESLLKIREEEEKRKEVSAKFQSTLADVTALMAQNNEKNCKLREDNLEMTKKFKSICEQYELREQQVEKISKQLTLESQLSDAKMTKMKMEMAAEKETLLREKQQLLLEVMESQAKIQDLQNTEASLRSQISLYTNKYDEFQNALSRSNDVFEGFKGEMEKMSKKICKLEKETSSWKQRWEKSHQALLEMAADKQQRDSELQRANRQLAQLQKLCRTLQGERTSLLAQLKAKTDVENTEKGQGDKDTCCLPNLDTIISSTPPTLDSAPSPESSQQQTEPDQLQKSPVVEVEQQTPPVSAVILPVLETNQLQECSVVEVKHQIPPVSAAIGQIPVPEINQQQESSVVEVEQQIPPVSAAIGQIPLPETNQQQESSVVVLEQSTLPATTVIGSEADKQQMSSIAEDEYQTLPELIVVGQDILPVPEVGQQQDSSVVEVKQQAPSVPAVSGQEVLPAQPQEVNQDQTSTEGLSGQSETVVVPNLLDLIPKETCVEHNNVESSSVTSQLSEPSSESQEEKKTASKKSKELGKKRKK